MRLVKIRQTRRLHGASPQDCTVGTHTNSHYRIEENTLAASQMDMWIFHLGRCTALNPQNRTTARPAPVQSQRLSLCFMLSKLFMHRVAFIRGARYLFSRVGLRCSALPAAPRCTRLRFPRCRAVELPRVIVIAAVIMTIMLMMTIPYEWVRRVWLCKITQTRKINENPHEATTFNMWMSSGGVTL